jgi:hypothetical protein
MTTTMRDAATTTKDRAAHGACAGDPGMTAIPGAAAAGDDGAENGADGEAGAVWPAATSGAPSSPH